MKTNAQGINSIQCNAMSLNIKGSDIKKAQCKIRIFRIR